MVGARRNSWTTERGGSGGRRVVPVSTTRCRGDRKRRWRSLRRATSPRGVTRRAAHRHATAVADRHARETAGRITVAAIWCCWEPKRADRQRHVVWSAAHAISIAGTSRRQESHARITQECGWGVGIIHCHSGWIPFDPTRVPPPRRRQRPTRTMLGRGRARQREVGEPRRSRCGPTLLSGSSRCWTNGRESAVACVSTADWSSVRRSGRDVTKRGSASLVSRMRKYIRIVLRKGYILNEVPGYALMFEFEGATVHCSCTDFYVATSPPAPWSAGPSTLSRPDACRRCHGLQGAPRSPASGAPHACTQ